MEKIQKKYIKLVLKLERNTPDYVILKETDIRKIRISTVKRTIKYEEKLSKQAEDSILGECWRVQQRRAKKKMQEERRKFLEERGTSTDEYEEKLKREGRIWESIEGKSI